MRTATANEVVNAAAQELGLLTSTVADVYASTDAVVVRLRALLEGMGQDLVRMRPWTHLQKEATVTTVNGTASYSLPADYSSMVPLTHWNRSADLPLAGPVGPQGWQLLVSSDTVSSVTYFFRVQANRLYLNPTPTAADTLAYEYVSAYWVQPSGETTPTAETPTASTDTIWFDKRLLVSGLKLAWLESNGFESTAARNAYEAALSAVSGGDGAQPALSLAPVGRRHGPSLPETNWGV